MTPDPSVPDRLFVMVSHPLGRRVFTGRIELSRRSVGKYPVTVWRCTHRHRSDETARACATKRLEHGKLEAATRRALA